LPQDEGLGAVRVCELHTPVIVVADDAGADDPVDAPVVSGALADALAAAFAFAKADGPVGSSELLLC